MNAMAPTKDESAAILARRVHIMGMICLIDERIAAKHGNSVGINARHLLRTFEAAGLGELTSPPGTDGHAVGLTLYGVRGRCSNNGAVATLRLWREAATDALEYL
jgi:hypothetical protein